MSLANLEITIGRIKSATKDSPIACFRTPVPELIDSMFADTIRTQRLIDNNDPDLIGVYHGGMNLAQIKKVLQAEIK